MKVIDNRRENAKWKIGDFICCHGDYYLVIWLNKDNEYGLLRLEDNNVLNDSFESIEDLQEDYGDSEDEIVKAHVVVGEDEEDETE